MIRNLIMHIWPVKDRGVWQWNVAQILRRMDLFNGQRFVSIVTGPDTDSFETVKHAFRGTVKNFLHFQNIPELGEVVSFGELLDRVNNIDERQATFYCHAKGVRHKNNHPFSPQIRKWTAAMYASLLDYPGLIVDQLRDHPVTGSFLKASPGFSKEGCEWHYSGTFFWFKNREIFSQHGWNRICRAYWGAEAWPGLVCPLAQAGTVFRIDRPMGWHMYHRDFWETTVDRPWKQWQIDHCDLRRAQSHREVLHGLQASGAQRVVVTGPQRSGTTIAAKMLANDLGFRYVDETTFAGHDFHGLLRALDPARVVVQAPALSRYVELLPKTSVVWMRRNLADVLRSQKRLGLDIFADAKKPFDPNEHAERDAYGEHSHKPLAIAKTKYWEQFQRISLGERAYDLNYESLKSHPLWIDPDKRKGFADRQTCYS